MDDRSAERATRELKRWLIEEGRFTETTEGFDVALVERLRAAGLPITRFTTGVPSLHPHVDSFSSLWEEGKGLSFRTYRRTPDQVGQLLGSPMHVVYEEARTVRCDLEGPPEDDAYEILAEFRAAGLTEYIAMPIPFSDGSQKAVTYATNRPGGFTDSEIGVLEAIRHDLAAAFEIRYLRHLARTLMETYVGPVAGQRVLDGAIKRGTGETIRAAIWFCDLRGFSTLSESLSGDGVIDLLNDYFDVVTSAIEEQDGEILKFIGDAVLAIFMPTSDDDPKEAVRRALAAADAADRSMAARNAGRREVAKPEIGFGIALHFGDVIYGNVGGQNRLDFTVIGPAVNLAARMEGLAGELGRQILVSSEFAAIHEGNFAPIGEFALKGLSGKRSVFAPAG